MDWGKLLNSTRVREALGGLKSDQAKSDHRTQFERDYDRALFSSVVRRLQDKTQVFPLDPTDVVRTRLTHSLEVSNVARGLAREVVTELRNKGLSFDDGEAIVSIATTCGLLHDVGNPPFGHAGEDAMREWFDQLILREPDLEAALKGRDSQFAQDFRLFEGNAQTIRLLARLQMLADRHGLDLTIGTLSAMCKYIAPSDRIEKGPAKRHEWSKPGFFTSEQELVELLQSRSGTGERRNPITYLVEASDDAVYSVVDIEDGLRKGVISWEELKEHFSRCAHATELLKRAENGVEKRSEKWPLDPHTRDEARVQLFRTYAISDHVAAAAKVFLAKYESIMAGDYHAELLEEGSSKELLKECKRIGYERVYVSHETLKLEIMGRSVIRDLLSRFWEGVKEAPHTTKRPFPEKIYALLSRNYRKIFEAEVEKDTLPKDYLRLQLVADYVAGMTDSFALRLRDRLYA